MQLQYYFKNYLDYCQYRKELDAKTLKAYKIDLNQYIFLLLSIKSFAMLKAL